MKSISNQIRKLKYSEEAVYIFSQMGNKKGAKESMELYTLKVALQVGFWIFLCQLILVIILGLV